MTQLGEVFPPLSVFIDTCENYLTQKVIPVTLNDSKSSYFPKYLCFTLQLVNLIIYMPTLVPYNTPNIHLVFLWLDNLISSNYFLLPPECVLQIIVYNKVPPPRQIYLQLITAEDSWSQVHHIIWMITLMFVHVATMTHCKWSLLS